MEYLVAWSSATRETHGDEQSRRGVANYAAAARYAAAPETTHSHGSSARWSAGDARRDAADLWSSVQSSRSTGVTCCQEQSSGGLPNLGVVCVKHARRQRRRGRRQRVDSRRAEAHQRRRGRRQRVDSRRAEAHQRRRGRRQRVSGSTPAAQKHTRRRHWTQRTVS